MSDLPHSGLPQLVASLAVAAIATVFVGGLVLWIVGSALHRPIWKIGARLSAGAVAGLAIYGGLELLAFAALFPLTGFGLLEGLLFAVLGVFAVGLGVVAVRWVMRYDIADAPWQGPERSPDGQHDDGTSSVRNGRVG